MRDVQRHLERLEWAPRPDVDLDRWPFTVPAVRQLIDAGGLDVPAGVTVLLGENGSGKSTLIEAIAEVSPRRGHLGPPGAVGPSLVADERGRSAVAWHLRARTHPMASRAGYFLRHIT